MPAADRLARGGAGAGGVLALGEAEGHRAGGRLLGQGEQVVGLAAEQGVPDREADAVLEADVGAHGVGEAVDPRRAVGVGAAEPGQAQGGALDGDGGVLGREVDDRLADLAGERAGPAYVGTVQSESAELAGGLRRTGHQSLRSKSPRTPASPRSSSMAYAAWPGT